MDRNKLIEKIRKFPDAPGVYLMKDVGNGILYVGKASSLKKRVMSYFQRPAEARIELMVQKIANIETRQTDTVIEALFLENNLIKKYQPKYNIKLKDGKSFLGIYITHEDWPRVMPARLTEKLPPGEFYGPFPQTTYVRDALQIIRKIFPFRYSCEPLSGRACFEYHLGMCPGVCAGKLTKEEYAVTIRQIKDFLKGNKKRVIAELEKEMRKASRRQEFEKAAKLRNQIFSLKHIHDVALIKEDAIVTDKDIPSRIEAYDISNIQGEFSVGSMVVFTEGLIDKSQYRKFKIRTVKGANDVESIKEVLSRRLNHAEWPLPDIFLIDGGNGQVNAAKEILRERKIKLPVVGIAKGPDRKQDRLVSEKGMAFDKKLLLRVRNEAHRFAIEYYRLLHRKSLHSVGLF